MGDISAKEKRRRQDHPPGRVPQKMAGAQLKTHARENHQEGVRVLADLLAQLGMASQELLRPIAVRFPLVRKCELQRIVDHSFVDRYDTMLSRSKPRAATPSPHARRDYL